MSGRSRFAGLTDGLTPLHMSPRPRPDNAIADPADGGMLDVVGFDTATPQLIAGFARGTR
jgi:hypothetical protein